MPCIWPGAACAVPFMDETPLTEQVWLHVQGVVAAHIPRRVAAMQGDGAHDAAPAAAGDGTGSVTFRMAWPIV